MSASGMRIRVRTKPSVEKGMRAPLVIRSAEKQLAVDAMIVWVKRPRVLEKVWEIGVRIEDPSPLVRAAMQAYGKYGFFPAQAEAVADGVGGGSHAADAGRDVSGSSGIGGTSAGTTATAASGTSRGAAGARNPAGGPGSVGPGGRAGAAANVEIEDLYALLGVAHDASEDQIRSAFRALARKLHPDTEAGSEEQFVRVKKAYSVLRDEGMRRKYDELLRRCARAA